MTRSLLFLVVSSVLTSSAPAESQSARAEHGQVADRNRILGKETAPVWLLIVSDFQCPYCRQWHKETWDAVRREFVETGKVRVAYMNLPLSIHPNAKPAARYAMCASAQGKFWEYADQLFNTQDQWKELPDPTAFFDRLLDKVRLTKASAAPCLSDSGIPALVDADYARMSRAGARSTPTFFVGRTMIEGAEPIGRFRQVIAAELAAAAKR
jgi:protein-disulfide isomerase